MKKFKGGNNQQEDLRLLSLYNIRFVRWGWEKISIHALAGSLACLPLDGCWRGPHGLDR